MAKSQLNELTEMLMAQARSLRSVNDEHLDITIKKSKELRELGGRLIEIGKLELDMAKTFNGTVAGDSTKRQIGEGGAMHFLTGSE
jgi:ribosomal protein L17